MRVWITRSQPGADRTADRLAVLGHDALVAPVLRIERLPVAPPDLERVSALAFTSASGVEAFAVLTPDRDRPVFAVGEATATAARAAGWRDVRNADGDGAALARLIVATLGATANGQDGSAPLGVLAPGAREPAFDLARALAEGGIRACALPVYTTTGLSTPPPAAAAVLTAGALDALLVHSPAAARVLAGYAAADGAFASASARLRAFALSRACAVPLPTAAVPAAWPSTPNDAALLALLPLGARPRLR